MDLARKMIQQLCEAADMAYRKAKLAGLEKSVGTRMSRILNAGCFRLAQDSRRGGRDCSPGSMALAGIGELVFMISPQPRIFSSGNCLGWF